MSVASTRRRVPIWVHQVVAYVSGAIIIGFAAHAPSADSPVLLIAAGLVLALAVTTKGPLGALRVLGRRTLRLAEAVAGAILAVLPFFQSGGPRLEVVVIAWVVAVALIRLAVLPAGRVVSETASPAQPAAPRSADPAVPPTVLDRAVRQAGRRTGEAGRRVRQVTDQAQPAVLRGARALGRVAGRRQAGRGHTEPPAGNTD